MAAKRVEGVQIERSADEILALKSDSHEAHALNQSAAVVYDLCDGQTPKSEMAKALHSRTGLPADEEIVDLALSELAETGLVVIDAADNVAAITRRSLIRRLSLTSAVAMMLPLVESVVLPSAADAAPSVTPVPSFTPVPVFTPVFVPRFAPTPTPIEG